MRRSAWLLLFLIAWTMSCGGGGSTSSAVSNNTPPPPLTPQLVALSDMNQQTYLGFSGGLYPNGNSMPSAHYAEGVQRGHAVQPLDVYGNASSSGKYVLLSIGMSNTTQEWCTASGAVCNSWSFTGQALADPAVNKTQLVIANGAAGGKDAKFWDDPTKPDYDRVRDNVLANLGLSEKQVQAVWLKEANIHPTVSLPSPRADAYFLEEELGKIVRALKIRYPNLQQVFLSSRIYAGYANTALNPEPYAYESGFSVKWSIESQMNQMRGNSPDPNAGDLNYHSVAPWIAWGPYLWANGTKARSDGLTWVQSEFEDDGTHPGTPAEQKVGQMLLVFFKTSPHTRCWFVVGGTCE